MNNTLWIDFLSVRQGARKSGFPPCSKGEGIQSVLDKTYLQEGSTEDRAFAGKKAWLVGRLWGVHIQCFCWSHFQLFNV